MSNPASDAGGVRPIAIDLEGSEFMAAEPLAIGLEAASSGDVPVDLPEAAPHLARVQTGFGYDRNTGDAIPLYDDEDTQL